MHQIFTDIASRSLPSWMVSQESLVEHSRNFYALYGIIRPTYHTQLLSAIARLWPGEVNTVLDMGAGDGLIGSAIESYFPVQQVQGLDISLRAHPKSTIDIQLYDGHRIPYSDNTFDVTLLINVVHHVCPERRQAFMREIKRITRKSIIIKDHLATGLYSRSILKLMDYIGNIPFGGMIQASYLTSSSWENLFEELDLGWQGYRGLKIQQGMRSLLFRDSLEIMIRADL